MEKKLTSADVKVGAKFGRWTVLEINTYDPNSKAKKQPKKALCQCECGTLRYKPYNTLYNGISLSCGCYARELLSKRNREGTIVKEGTRFGKLTVIKDLGLRKQKSRDKNESWSLCRCDCGNEIEVRTNNLKTGITQSCGCVKSRGETAIAQLLRDNNISFSKEYAFSDLKTEKNGTLKFDFAIFKNNKLFSLIEFDGRQHYFGPDATWAESDDLATIKHRDEMKNEYCKQHDIPLIRVPYYDIGKISLEYLGLTDFWKD